MYSWYHIFLPLPFQCVWSWLIIIIVGTTTTTTKKKRREKKKKKVVEEIVTAHHAKINYGANGKLDHDKDEGKKKPNNRRRTVNISTILPLASIRCIDVGNATGIFTSIFGCKFFSSSSFFYDDHYPHPICYLGNKLLNVSAHKNDFVAPKTHVNIASNWNYPMKIIIIPMILRF